MSRLRGLSRLGTLGEDPGSLGGVKGAQPIAPRLDIPGEMDHIGVLGIRAHSRIYPTLDFYSRLDAGRLARGDQPLWIRDAAYLNLDDTQSLQLFFHGIQFEKSLEVFVFTPDAVPFGHGFLERNPAVDPRGSLQRMLSYHRGLSVSDSLEREFGWYTDHLRC